VNYGLPWRKSRGGLSKGEKQVASQPPRVVVTDGTPSSIAIYQRSTQSLAVDLHTFLSPKDSLGYLRDHDADLVFVDILMREKDGLGFLRELRSMDRHRDTRVIVVTSKDYNQDRALARQWGTLEYLLKPLRSQEIREIIQRYTLTSGAGDDTRAT
jgi:DNA-binding response OmpR family regulator